MNFRIFGWSILCILLLIFGDARAQKALPTGLQIEENAKATSKAIPGSYQIVYKDKAHAEAISADILYRVEQERDEKDIRYLIINEFVKIKILPKSVISAKGFVPLEEFIIAE